MLHEFDVEIAAIANRQHALVTLGQVRSVVPKETVDRFVHELSPLTPLARLLEPATAK